MNTTLPPFPNLRNAILNLEKCLNCTYCYRVFTDPFTLTTCGHTFCRQCITSFISAQEANCPLCNLPNWLNQSQPNRQLKALMQNYDKLRNLLAIPNPNTPVHACIQSRVEKKRKRKKIDLFEVSIPNTIEEEGHKGIHNTPSPVINPNNEIIPVKNTEFINLHCTETLVENEKNIHSPGFETRSLPNGLEACFEQIDNDKLPDIDNTITRTSNLEQNITLESVDTLHEPQLVSIDHTSSPVLSQEINLNGLNLTQTNSQEISLNQNNISKSDDLQINTRLASQQKTPQSSFIGKFGKPIPLQISQSKSPFLQSFSHKAVNSPFIQQTFSSPNLSTNIGEQLNSQQQQTFPSPITKQKDVTPSCHTPNNTHMSDVLQTHSPDCSSNKQLDSILYSSPNEFEQNIFLDPNNLTSTPERLNNSPTADHTSEMFLTASSIHNSVLMATTEELENLVPVQPVFIDHPDNSRSLSPELLISSRISESIKHPVVELAENITEQPNECHSIHNSPIIAVLHSESQKNHISPVKESRNIYNSPAHTPLIIDKTDFDTETDTLSPIQVDLRCSQEQLAPDIETYVDYTAPISHTSLVIEESCISSHTTQYHTSIPTPGYQQPNNNSVGISILIEDDSLPDVPTQVVQIKPQFPTDIQTIVVSDDSSDKSTEVKKVPHRPRQLYPKKVHSNWGPKLNIHNTALPTTNTSSMENFFNTLHQSQPSSKPHFNYPTIRSTKFEEFDTFDTTQFKYFPQTSPQSSVNSMSKLKSFPDEITGDYLFNFIRNQTQEQRRPKLDIRKFSNNNQNSFLGNISNVNERPQLLSTPLNSNKQDAFSSIPQTHNTPNETANNLKETLLSTDDKIDNIIVDHNNNLLPEENCEVEILLTPVSIPNFDSPIVTEQITCVVEDLVTNNEDKRDESEHIETCHPQTADCVSNNSPTNTPMISTPENIPSPLVHIESKIAENGDVSGLNDGDITPTNQLTNSQSNHSIPSLIISPPHNDIDTIGVDNEIAILISPNTSPHMHTSPIAQQLSLPYNTENFDVFAIKDSPAIPSILSPKHRTNITSPTNLSRFATLQSCTPNHKYENTQPHNTPPPCSQFSQMNEVLSLARDLENRFSKNETIDSDTDSVFSLTQSSPKPNSNNFISYLTPKTHTFPTPPSVAKELSQGMERFNSPLGVSIFDYADMGIDENTNMIPHFSPSIGSPPTLNPVKRRANTFQSKKPKLESYKLSEQQALRILSPKKGNEISNFSNRPFRNKGKPRYKQRSFQAN